ncbi:hypothetical protein [Actinoplanes sp. TFC3]|uniref:hypothetical protein n=1 Tax=Actinoplanes sp. TFC3 TaxID=1710355 RepID=UPI00082D64CE|nr:hypothetical protein [Actinoplanes sp. TFC3]
MTGAEFSGVDIDLLADFVGGALDGTPDEVLVARRIADDPAWQEAFVELSAGSGAVSTALKAWGREPEPMPADVAERVEAALAAPPPPRLVAVPNDPPVTSTGNRPVSSDGDRPVVSRRSKRVRRLKWAAPLGVAAAALAFLGFGPDLGSSDSSGDSLSSAASVPEAATLAALPAQTESGIDYTRQTLDQAVSRTLLGSKDARAYGEGSPDVATSKASTTEGALGRLRLVEALHACIEAINAESGAAPITVQTVDYARFQGSPALIVHFSATSGAWVWAVGPECGTPGTGSGALASVQVG